MANSSAHLIDAGAVVFTRDATIGLAAITARQMAVSQHIIGWVCGPHLDNRFLLRVIDAMRPELERLTFGATLKTIGMEDIRELVTPMPPLQEQVEIFERISIECGRIDSLVEKTSAVIDLLRQYRQALITAAVTGQLDLTADATDLPLAASPTPTFGAPP